VDDLRGSNVPPRAVAYDSSAGTVSAVGQRLGATSDVARARAVASSDPPPRQSDPDVARAKNWLPWIIVGTGFLASAFMAKTFGGTPRFLRSDTAQTPSAPAAPAAKPPEPANPAAPAAAPTPAPAAPATAPAATPPATAPLALRYLLEVQSDPSGARVTGGGNSLIAPGTLDLGVPAGKIEVVAELDGYEPQLLQLEPADFQAKGDGRLVRSAAFKLVARPQAPPPKAAPAQTLASPPLEPTRKPQAPKAPLPPRTTTTKPAAAPSSAPAAPPQTPQIAKPPVPIGAATPPTATPPAPTASSTPAAPPVLNIVPAGESNPTAAAQPQPSPLARATDCLSRGDNACVIAALEGQAQSEREYVILIETHLAMGKSADAERNMRKYLSLYPNGPSAPKYKRALEKRGTTEGAEAPAGTP
jgi:hypothetical protein